LHNWLKILSHFVRPGGRMARRWYWFASVGVIALFLFLLPLIDAVANRWLTIVAFLPLYWILFCLMSQRCHDVGISSAWLGVLVLPIIGIVWCVAVLGFRRGDLGENQYGVDPRTPPPDYLVVQAIS
jgi:uncharacterized membrane protein YhaH (DUF805 family)